MAAKDTFDVKVSPGVGKFELVDALTESSTIANLRGAATCKVTIPVGSNTEKDPVTIQPGIVAKLKLLTVRPLRVYVKPQPKDKEKVEEIPLPIDPIIDRDQLVQFLKFSVKQTEPKPADATQSKSESTGVKDENWLGLGRAQVYYEGSLLGLANPKSASVQLIFTFKKPTDATVLFTPENKAKYSEVTAVVVQISTAYGDDPEQGQKSNGTSSASDSSKRSE